MRLRHEMVDVGGAHSLFWWSWPSFLGNGRVMQPDSTSKKPRSVAGHSQIPSWPPPLGLLVTDSSMKLLFANQEAVAILTYPGPPLLNLTDALQRKVRTSLMQVQSSSTNRNEIHSVVKFKSGRRTYLCRAFVLDSNGRGAGTATLMMLERGISGPVALDQLTQQFHFTQREHQAVALLLQGLSNKEMAEKMGISANTVKVFLRMASIKMGVSSRSGIVTKILGLFLSADNPERTNQF